MGILRRLALASLLVLLIFSVLACSTPAAPNSARTPEPALPPANIPPTPTAVATTAAPTLAPAGNFVLTSAALTEGGTIPKKYSCDERTTSARGDFPALGKLGILALVIFDFGF